MAIQLIVGQGVTPNRIFLRKCARWSRLCDFTAGQGRVRRHEHPVGGVADASHCPRPPAHTRSVITPGPLDCGGDGYPGVCCALCQYAAARAEGAWGAGSPPRQRLTTYRLPNNPWDTKEAGTYPEGEHGTAVLHETSIWYDGGAHSPSNTDL